MQVRGAGGSPRHTLPHFATPHLILRVLCLCCCGLCCACAEVACAPAPPCAPPLPHHVPCPCPTMCSAPAPPCALPLPHHVSCLLPTRAPPPPPCRCLEYSFAQEPEFDIRFSPVGYTAFQGELPGLINSLRQLLIKVRACMHRCLPAGGMASWAGGGLAGTWDTIRWWEGGWEGGRGTMHACTGVDHILFYLSISVSFAFVSFWVRLNSVREVDVDP